MQSPAEAEPVSRRFDPGLLAHEAKLLLELAFREVGPPLQVIRVGIPPDFNMASDSVITCIRQAIPNRCAFRLVFPRLGREGPSSIAPNSTAPIPSPPTFRSCLVGMPFGKLSHPQALVKNRPTLSPIIPSGVLVDNRPPPPTRMLKRDSICPPFNRAVSIVSCSLTLRLTTRRAVIRDTICRLDSLCVLP